MIPNDYLYRALDGVSTYIIYFMAKVIRLFREHIQTQRHATDIGFYASAQKIDDNGRAKAMIWYSVDACLEQFVTLI